LTGNLEVPNDTLTTVESVFGRARIRGEEEIKRIRKLVDSHVDLDRLMDCIGL
jgi:BioD-like phosphotransacetylase family protein